MARETLITIVLLYFYTNKSRIQARNVKKLKKQDYGEPVRSSRSLRFLRY